MSSRSRGGHGSYGNLLWLATLFVILLAIAAVWIKGDDLFAPSRETWVVRVFREASPAVVNISAQRLSERSDLPAWPGQGMPWMENFFKQFFGLQGIGPEANLPNLGSGIIVDGRGYILTNEHVVTNTARIQVTLADGRTVAGEVWGTEPSLDLAVIKIETEDPLPYLAMGRSDDIMIGEPVALIGNPLGLGHTCSAGIVSSLHRAVKAGDRVYRELMQLDASVNPGNSGGPVLNIRGELIGITSALPLDTTAQGIGFAIPIDRARRVVDDLIKYHYVPTGWLGVSVEDMGSAAEAFGLSRGKGVFISRIEEKSPAAKELKPGDVITDWDGTEIRDLADFVEKAQELRASQELVLTRVRDGESKKVKLTSGAFPEESSEDWAWFHLGIRVNEGQVRAQTPDGRIVVKSGVFIQGIAGNSMAQKSGLAPGDLILRLNRDEIGGMADFRQAIAQLRLRDNIFFVFRRGGYSLPLWVTVPFQLSGERW